MKFKEIQDNFFNRHFDFDAHATWVIGLAIACGIIILLLIIRWLLNRNRVYIPVDRVTNQSQIRDILEIAFDQRRLFEIQVSADNNTRRPTLRCSPEGFVKDGINLELNSIKQLSENWLGRPVSIYFRVKLNGDFIFYTFASTIKSIHVPKTGICVITVGLPQYLDNRQKRSFLRIQPPEEFVLGGALWYGQSMPEADRLNDLSLWPRPLLLSLPGKLEQFRFMDLSAGGARIVIPSATSRQYRLQFATISQVMLMLDLHDPEQNKRIRFWLLCRIQSVWMEHVSHDIQLGVQIIAWAKPKDPPNEFTHPGGALEWMKLSNVQDVEPLGNWIMRRHLELFRDTTDEI